MIGYSLHEVFLEPDVLFFDAARKLVWLKETIVSDFEARPESNDMDKTKFKKATCWGLEVEKAGQELDKEPAATPLGPIRPLPKLGTGETDGK